VNDVVNSPLENEIQALVDGRLDPARRVEVEAWLAAHPDEAARVRDMSAQRAAVEDAFSGLLDRPVPARLRSAVKGRVQTAPVMRGWPRWWRWLSSGRRAAGSQMKR